MRQKSPLEEFTKKADRLNEFPGKEIGIDYDLPSNIEIDSLAQAIFDEFKNDTNSPYQIARSLPSIVESRTKYFKYATKDNGEKIKLFTISIRDRDGVISIKR